MLLGRDDRPGHPRACEPHAPTLCTPANYPVPPMVPPLVMLLPILHTPYSILPPPTFALLHAASLHLHLYTASPWSTEPLSLLASNVCPVSPCHRAHVSPRGSPRSYQPVNQLILYSILHTRYSGLTRHLNLNAPPLFHLISVSYAHRLRANPPHDLTLGFRRRTLRSHRRPSGRLAPADCSVRYGHAGELHEARRAPASIRPVAFRAG